MEIGLNLRTEFHDHQGGIKDADIHHNGRLFFTRSDEMLILYDLVSNRKIIGFYDSAGYDAASFDPCGLMLIYSSGDHLHYWDIAREREAMVVPGVLSEFRDRDVHAGLRLSADGNNEGNIEIRKLDADPDGPPECVLEGHKGYIEYVRFHPNGKILASGSADMTLRFWNLESRQEISSHKVHDDVVTAIAFTPDGSIAVTGDYSGILKVWDLKITD